MITIKGWTNHRNIAIMSKGNERISVKAAVAMLDTVRMCGLSACEVHSADGQWKFAFRVHENGRIILEQIA